MSPALPDASRAGLRARRWDVVVLGSGISSMMAAARLCEAGLQVLVLEEDNASQLFPGLREPFHLSGGRAHGIVETVLRELKLPLIDRRRVAPTPLAYQVIGPGCRLDVGEADLTADELVAWGLAKPESARALVRALTEAAEAERGAMLDAPFVRTSRRVGLARTRMGSHLRGTPAEVTSADPPLARVLAAQSRAHSNLGACEPGPEARARLLGAPLMGGSHYTGPAPWLLGTLRRRVESLHGEFRTLGGSFSLASSHGLPAVAVERSKELWIGRALVIAAPLSALKRALGDEAPGFSKAARSASQRISLHWRTPPEQLLEGMGERLILIPDPAQDSPDVGETTLSIFASDKQGRYVDVVARAVVPGDAVRAVSEAEIERRVRQLLPFAGDQLVACPFNPPTWDDDDCLEDPPPGESWPVEIDLRLSSRPLVFHLDRAPIAGLGIEGDLLLGWRGGDAIAAELR